MTFPAKLALAAPSTVIAGRSVAVLYSNISEEYDALQNGAALFDRSFRHRLLMTGTGAAEALNGLVTNDILQLQEGRGMYAAALSAKGRILADLRIFRRTDGIFLIDTAPRCAEAWMTVVRKYVNPRTAKYTDVSEAISNVGVFGPQAVDQVAQLTGLQVGALEHSDAYVVMSAELSFGPVTVVRTPGPGVPGFDLFVQTDSSATMVERLLDAGCKPAGVQAWEISRIEHGIPEWGLDMDEGTLAQEANLDKLHAISFTKGCYTGQETVARVHFRGHVNKHLRGLRFLSDEVPPLGAEVFGAEDKLIGDVRSSIRSPRLGGVAIAMLRREVLPGSTATVRWDGNNECQAGVYELHGTTSHS